jgi:drug/metabolite transporter (DMT)-like permease
MWALFLGLAAIWGSSFLFIEVALADDVGPYTLASLRSLFGAAFLAGVMALRRGGRPGGAWAWRRYTFLGLTNLAIPFLLIIWAQLSITSGMAAILNALVPLFAVILGSFILFDERATPSRIAGLLLGFAGVVALAVPSLAAASSGADGLTVLLGMLAVAAASFSYASGAIYARHRVAREPLMRTPDGAGRAPTVVELSFWQVLMASAILLPLAIIIEQPGAGILALPASFGGWFAIIWLGILSTGVAYVLFFRVMSAWGPTRATMVTYVIPPIAILLGFVLLDERFAAIELVGTALIIGGIVIVNSRPSRPIVEPESGTA